MPRSAFAFWHCAVLLIVLLLPKTLKAFSLAPDSRWSDLAGVLVPDLLFVIAVEVLVFRLAAISGARAGRWIRAGWGFAVIPMAVYAAVEHRFFLATGSILDWPLFWHGVTRINEISGVVKAELTAFWWAAILVAILLGVLTAILGYRSPEGRMMLARGRTRAMAVAVFGLVVLGWWWWVALGDPRLVQLRTSIYWSMGLDIAANLKETSPDAQAHWEAVELPEPVVLEAGPDSHLDNLVFLVLESVRADATTPYTPELDTSPFLAKLAGEGMLVEHGYTLVPHTTKSLVPILCGISPDIRQALSEAVPGGLPVPCLPSLLRPLGYATAHFQAASGRFEQRRILMNGAGFEKCTTLEDLDRKKWESPNYLGVEDRALVRPVMKWVDEQQGPFLLSILTLITHHDYKVPTYFPTKDYGVSKRWTGYLNTIRYTDQFLEELFDEFETRGLLDHTLFVIVGDHGEGHGEHGRKGHDAIAYQEGIHVPYILWGPDLIPEPVVVKGNRMLLDILPTIADLLNLEVVQGSFEGVSLLESVDGRTSFVSCWYRDRCLGRLSGDMKVIYYYGRAPMEVFDLSKDPGEKENLANQVPQRELDRYVAEMKAWKREKQQLWLAHKRRKGEGAVLFERPEPGHDLDARFGRVLDVVGYDVTSLKVRQPASLTVFVKVKSTLGWHRKFKLELNDGVDMTRELWARSTEKNYPMYTWVPGTYMKVVLEFSVPQAARPGSGYLWLYLMNGKKKTPVRGSDTQEDARRVEIPVDIRR